METRSKVSGGSKPLKKAMGAAKRQSGTPKNCVLPRDKNALLCFPVVLLVNIDISSKVLCGF